MIVTIANVIIIIMLHVKQDIISFELWVTSGKINHTNDPHKRMIARINKSFLVMVT